MAEKDSIFQRGQIRGYLFEMAILHLLLNNGFSRVSSNKTSKKDKNQVNRVRENRPFFVELRGRGGWHQIDCPCDYSILSPFMYPIRLIGEVKYYFFLIPFFRNMYFTKKTAKTAKYIIPEMLIMV